MTISVMCWAYNQSKKNIMLSKSNCGHSAFEILISAKKFQEYCKTNHFFNDLRKRKREFEEEKNKLIAQYSFMNLKNRDYDAKNERKFFLYSEMRAYSNAGNIELINQEKLRDKIAQLKNMGINIDKSKIALSESEKYRFTHEEFIKKKNEFSRSLAKYIDNIIFNHSKEPEYDNRLPELNEKCKNLRKKSLYFSKMSAILPKRIFKGKDKFISLYFSFWPDKSISIAGKYEMDKNITQAIDAKKNKQGFHDIRYQDYLDDLEDEAHGVDIKELYSDLKQDNLEHIWSIPRNAAANDDWAKKDKHFYIIKSGKSKGKMITEATYKTYKDLSHYFKKRYAIEKRFVALNILGSITNDLKTEAHKKSMQLLEKKYRVRKKDKLEFSDDLIDKDSIKFNSGVDFFDNIDCIKKSFEAISEELNNFLSEEYFHQFYNNDLYYQHIKELKSIRKILKEEYAYIMSLRNSNMLTQGLPPSHIISLPTKGLEGFGLDEFKIIDCWLEKIHRSMYSYTTTNCSWATIKSISVESKKHAYPPFFMNKITPTTPKNVVVYFKKVQDEMLKKYSKKLNNYNRNLLVPEKKIWTLSEFKKQYRIFGSGLFSCDASNQNLNHIEKLIESYHRLSNHDVKWRMKCIDDIADAISSWLEDKIDQIAAGKYKKFDAIKEILNQISIERESLVSYLFH